MKNNQLTVSIGIPAYNEEANIGYLLESLLGQKVESAKLIEILVFDDGSSDSTAQIVDSFNNPTIKIFKGKNRIGQQLRQNQIVKNYKSDILIILEGDTLPHDEYTIEELIHPFTQKINKKLGMVVGVHKAMTPKMLFEKILFHGHHLKQGIFNKWKNGDNIYNCGGHSMKALSRNFTDNLTWPKDVPEDAFTYMQLNKLNFKIKRTRKAVAYIRNVNNFADRIKQCSKFQSGKKSLVKYFGDEAVNSEYKIPIFLIILETIKYFLRQPFWTLMYLFEVFINRIYTKNAQEFKAKHEVYYSSKILLRAQRSSIHAQ